jgi:hypothetical protein
MYAMEYNDEKPTVPYQQVFEFTCGGSTYKVTQYFQRGAYGESFLCRKMIGPDEAGESYCIKFFTTAAASGPELAKIDDLRARQSGDPHPNVVSVVLSQREPLSPLQTRSSTSRTRMPGAYGFVLMELAHLGEPADYLQQVPCPYPLPLTRTQP